MTDAIGHTVEIPVSEIARLTQERDETREAARILDERCGDLNLGNIALERERDSARDEVERLTRERDEIMSRHLRYLAGIGEMLKTTRQWRDSGEPARSDRDEINALINERDTARAEVERMRPVVEAAFRLYRAPVAERPARERDLWREVCVWGCTVSAEEPTP